MEDTIKMKKALLMMQEAERLTRLVEVKSPKANMFMEESNASLRRSIDALEKSIRYESD
ncbi:MAG: hypothetical protein ACRBB6_13295 [Neptuniibacter sp.]